MAICTHFGSEHSLIVCGTQRVHSHECHRCQPTPCK